jgi:hypothetical protein
MFDKGRRCKNLRDVDEYGDRGERAESRTKKKIVRSNKETT